MGAKLGLWHWGRNTDWGCLRTGCWGKYLVQLSLESMRLAHAYQIPCSSFRSLSPVFKKLKADLNSAFQLQSSILIHRLNKYRNWVSLTCIDDQNVTRFQDVYWSKKFEYHCVSHIPVLLYVKFSFTMTLVTENFFIFEVFQWKIQTVVLCSFII
jgi:hypothetical protein